MLIHLMQHGACMPEELDKHQALSPVGREQIVKSAKAAAAMGLRFELIVASPKVRSIQTAEIMAEATGYPVSRIEVTEHVKAMAPAKDSIDFIGEYDGLDSILIAGHLPSLGSIATQLLTGRDILEINIENGGLMQIDSAPGMGKSVLNWYLSPAQMTLIANS